MQDVHTAVASSLNTQELIFRCEGGSYLSGMHTLKRSMTLTATAPAGYAGAAMQHEYTVSQVEPC